MTCIHKCHLFDLVALPWFLGQMNGCIMCMWCPFDLCTYVHYSDMIVISMHWCWFVCKARFARLGYITIVVQFLSPMPIEYCISSYPWKFPICLLVFSIVSINNTLGASTEQQPNLIVGQYMYIICRSSVGIWETLDADFISFRFLRTQHIL